MSAWIISLLGTVVITLISDVILPQGQTNKYIKTVLSVIIVCAIVFPLANLITDFSFESIFNTGNTIDYQQQYIDYVKEEKEISLADLCNKKLSSVGLGGCNAHVSLDEDLTPKSVIVEIEKDCYTEYFAKKVVETILQVVNVNKSEVSCIVKN